MNNAFKKGFYIEEIERVDGEFHILLYDIETEEYVEITDQTLKNNMNKIDYILTKMILYSIYYQQLKADKEKYKKRTYIKNVTK